MATSTINATYKGRVSMFVSAPLINWVGQVRNATTGTSAYTATGADNLNFSAALLSGRGGYIGTCNRVALFFDVSSITSSYTITSGTLKVYNSGVSVGTDSIPVKSTAWGGNGSVSTLSTSDYSNIDHSTAYASKDFSWGTGYNDFTLNATAIASMNSNGYLNVFMIEGDYDYDADNPPVGTSVSGTVRVNDATNKNKLELTYTAAGYGNDVIGVTAANIDNVIGVATANIDNIIGA